MTTGGHGYALAWLIVIVSWIVKQAGKEGERDTNLNVDVKCMLLILYEWDHKLNLVWWWVMVDGLANQVVELNGMAFISFLVYSLNQPKLSQVGHSKLENYVYIWQACIWQREKRVYRYFGKLSLDFAGWCEDGMGKCICIFKTL